MSEVVYSTILLAHVADEDAFYLVSPDGQLAIPTPRDLAGHLADLAAPADARLLCHPGQIEWPHAIEAP